MLQCPICLSLIGDYKTSILSIFKLGRIDCHNCAAKLRTTIPLNKSLIIFSTIILFASILTVIFMDNYLSFSFIPIAIAIYIYYCAKKATLVVSEPNSGEALFTVFNASITIMIGVVIFTMIFDIFYKNKAAKLVSDEPNEIIAYANPTSSHPFSGYWKESCEDRKSIIIAAISTSDYYVSYCDSNICNKKGTFDTKLKNAEKFKFQAINNNKIKILGPKGETTAIRCDFYESNPN